MIPIIVSTILEKDEPESFEKEMGKPLLFFALENAISSKSNNVTIVGNKFFPQVISQRIKTEFPQIPIYIKKNATHMDASFEYAYQKNLKNFILLECKELFINQNIINSFIDFIQKNGARHDGISCIAHARIKEIATPECIKVVLNSNKELIYLSRFPTPYTSDPNQCNFIKLLGMSYFNREGIKKYISNKKCELEEREKISLLRFINFKEAISTFFVEKEFPCFYENDKQSVFDLSDFLCQERAKEGKIPKPPRLTFF